jgi:hypothetical protein
VSDETATDNTGTDNRATEDSELHRLLVGRRGLPPEMLQFGDAGESGRHYEWKSADTPQPWTSREPRDAQPSSDSASYEGGERHRMRLEAPSPRPPPRTAKPRKASPPPNPPQSAATQIGPPTNEAPVATSAEPDDPNQELHNLIVSQGGLPPGLLQFGDAGDTDRRTEWRSQDVRQPWKSQDVRQPWVSREPAKPPPFDWVKFGKGFLEQYAIAGAHGMASWLILFPPTAPLVAAYHGYRLYENQKAIQEKMREYGAIHTVGGKSIVDKQGKEHVVEAGRDVVGTPSDVAGATAMIFDDLYNPLPVLQLVRGVKETSDLIEQGQSEDAGAAAFGAAQAGVDLTLMAVGGIKAAREMIGEAAGRTRGLGAGSRGLGEAGGEGRGLRPETGESGEPRSTTTEGEPGPRARRGDGPPPKALRSQSGPPTQVTENVSRRQAEFGTVEQASAAEANAAKARGDRAGLVQARARQRIASDGRAATAEIAKRLPEVVKYLNDPALWEEFVNDVCVEADRIRAQGAAAFDPGVTSAETQAVINLARTAGMKVEVVHDVLTNNRFFADWGGTDRSFIDLGIVKEIPDHGAVTHIAQDLVVDRGFRKAGQNYTSRQFRSELGRVDRARSALRLQSTPAGKQIWEYTYDSGDEGSFANPETLWPWLKKQLPEIQ